MPGGHGTIELQGEYLADASLDTQVIPMAPLVAIYLPLAGWESERGDRGAWHAARAIEGPQAGGGAPVDFPGCR